MNIKQIIFSKIWKISPCVGMCVQIPHSSLQFNINQVKALLLRFQNSCSIVKYYGLSTTNRLGLLGLGVSLNLWKIWDVNSELGFEFQITDF